MSKELLAGCQAFAGICLDVSKCTVYILVKYAVAENRSRQGVEDAGDHYIRSTGTHV
jgi:hypothetical protein